MRKISLFLLALFSTLMTFAQISQPITWSFSSAPKGDNQVELQFKATVESGWHLYGMQLPENGPRPTSFVFEKLNNAKIVGKISANKPLITKYDPIFESELSWYDQDVIFTQLIDVTAGKDYTISGYVEFMGCNDETCLAPESIPFSFGVPATTVATQASENITAETGENTTTASTEGSELFASKIYTPVIDQLKSFDGNQDTSRNSLLMIFILGMLGGFVALLTPCVWPIIPMTVSFFLKRSTDKHKGRRDAIFYGVAIVVIYLTLGILITLLFGASALNSLSTNAFFNLLFFALLVLFAVSFFGAFEITLPASWTTKLDQKADKSTGILSILLMAFTLVLVSFSCTGPIIGTLLVEISTTGSLLAPTIGMAGFAIALALPFSLFALFPSWLKSMPKSGGWMNSVKVVLGFLELALSLKFLSVADLAYGWGILDREVFIVLWIVIFALLGFYLLGKVRFPHDSEVKTVSVPRVFMAMISLAFAIYMIPGLWGAPLKSISAFAPPLYTQDFNMNKNDVHASFDNYEEGMRYAKEQGKPVMVDFSGFGCVNCRKMEASVWTNEKVAQLMHEKYVLITLFVDDKTPLAEPFSVTENGTTRQIKTVGDKNSYLQRYKFGSNAQPFYVLLDNDGNALTASYAFNEDPEPFVAFLEKGLEKY